MAVEQSSQKRQLWEARFVRFADSGLPVARFCAAEGISTNAFYYWAKRVSRVPAAVSAARPPQCRSTARQQPVTGASSEAPLVRFQGPNGVQVLVPADCLAALRCVAEYLPRSVPTDGEAFQEVVVRP
jgi:hypothetical protein